MRAMGEFSDQTETIARHLDARGLFCPEPVMMLHGAIRQIEVGQLLEVVATDPSTARDIPKFCQFLGHELVKKTESEELFTYRIRKGAAQRDAEES